MRKLFYKRDILIFIALIVLALAGLIAVWIYRSSANGKAAIIEHNSTEIQRINLDKITQSDIIFIDDGKNCQVEIEVEKGKIRVRSSSCPDKVCVNCGWLEKKGDTAVCLPNGVIVRIE